MMQISVDLKSNCLVQANLIITLSLGYIEVDCVISELCDNEVTFYRHKVK